MIELFEEMRGSIELGFLIAFAILVPPDQFFRTLLGIEIALRCPDDPPFPIRMGIEGQQFLTVLEPVPPDGAVSECGDSHATVLGNRDVPDNARNGHTPSWGPVASEVAQLGFRAEQKVFSIRCDRETAGDLPRRQADRLSVQFRRRPILPILDPEILVAAEQRETGVAPEGTFNDTLES